MYSYSIMAYYDCQDCHVTKGNKYLCDLCYRLESSSMAPSDVEYVPSDEETDRIRDLQRQQRQAKQEEQRQQHQISQLQGQQRQQQHPVATHPTITTSSHPQTAVHTSIPATHPASTGQHQGPIPIIAIPSSTKKTGYGDYDYDYDYGYRNSYKAIKDNVKQTADIRMTFS